MKNIVIIGGGDHAKVIISVIKKISELNIIGYIDPQDKGPVLGVKYIGDDSKLGGIIDKDKSCCAALGLGITISPKKKRELKEKLELLGFTLPVIVSPDSIVNDDANLENGSIVLDGAVINTGATIGECSVVYTASVIEHDCKIGDFVYISPRAVVCGGVTIGHNSVIGANVTIIQHKTVCNDCVIGAGAVVVDDCLVSGTYLGIPAKKK